MNKNQRLGDLGENAFNAACLLAGLNPTIPVPDRYGKDFVVEWDMPLQGIKHGQPLDSRPPPLVCVIQVKTISAKARSIKLKLSAALRLVHENRPCFIVALKHNNSSIGDNFHILHVSEEQISKILKATRKAEKGGSSISKRSITFGLNDFDTLVPKEGIRAAFENFVDTGVTDYSVWKERLRKSVGIDSEKYLKANVTLSSSNVDEILEGLIGDKELDCSRFETSTERFGIELPGWPNMPTETNIYGKIAFSPQGIEGNKLHILSKSGEKVSLIGTIKVAPLIYNARFLARFEVGDLTIDIRENGLKINFDAPNLINREACLIESALTLKALKALRDVKSFYFETVDGHKSDVFEPEIYFPNSLEDGLEALIALIEAITYLLQRAQAPSSVIRLGDIDNRLELLYLSDLFQERRNPINFEIAEVKLEETDNKIDFSGYNKILFSNYVCIGKKMLALHLEIEADLVREGEVLKIVQKHCRPLDLAFLDPSNIKNSFEYNANKIRRLTGIPFCIVGEIQD